LGSRPTPTKTTPALAAVPRQSLSSKTLEKTTGKTPSQTTGKTLKKVADKMAKQAAGKTPRTVAGNTQTQTQATAWQHAELLRQVGKEQLPGDFGHEANRLDLAGNTASVPRQPRHRTPFPAEEGTAELLPLPPCL
jgi:hypothetical protein